MSVSASAPVIPVTRTSSPRPRPAEDALGFGKYFADHMLVVDYTEGQGWHDARIVPYGTLALDPAASVLHYGQAMFEGLKAYRLADGRVSLFRADRNAHRMATGAGRLSIPAIDESLFVQGIAQLVSTDADWVPSAPGTALYVRPTIIATEPFLGVRASGRTPSMSSRARSGPITPGAEAGADLGRARTRARGQGWHRRSQGRGQLRRQPAGGRGGARARLRPGPVARRHRARVSRGSGHDEPVPGDRRHARDAAARGQHPPRHHPRHGADDCARLGTAGRRTSRVDDRSAGHACEGHAAGSLRRGNRSRRVGCRDAGQRAG